MRQFGSLVEVGGVSHNFSEELKVTLINDPPFVFIEEDSLGNVYQRGYLLDLWRIVAENLSLSYRILPAPPGGFGFHLPNGTWTGLVGECAQKRADVALSWLLHTGDRAAVLDYIDVVPVFHGDYNFYVRSGERDTPRLTSGMVASLMRPLDINVWLLLLLSLLVLAVVLTVTVRLSSFRRETDLTRHEFTFGSSCLFAFMTVTGQGWALTPDSVSARIVTFSSWIMGILISVNYTANLISYVTVSQPEAPINSLAEFDSTTDWTFASEFGSVTLGKWARSNNPAERHLYEMMISGDRFLALDGSEENIRRATGPKTLLFYNLDVAFTVIKDDACHLMPLDDQPVALKKAQTYLVLRKGLGPLKRAINRVMLQMQQSGTLHRLKRQWFGDGRGVCSDAAVFRPLALADLLAVLVIVPLAAAGACLLLTAELLSRRLVHVSLLPGPGPATGGRRYSERVWSASATGFLKLRKQYFTPDRLLGKD